MSVSHNPSSSIQQLRSFQRPARLFLLATTLDGIVFSAWSLFFNFYILERGFSKDFLGLVNAMPAVATLLLGLPAGLLSDRIGRKRAMVLGVCVSIIGMGLQVTVSSPTLILAMAFLTGAASSLYFLSQAPFMMKASDKDNRTLLFSLNFGLVTLAGAVGSLFAGQLPALFGSWLDVSPSSAAAYQAVLLVSVALSFLTLIPLLMINEGGKKTKNERRTTEEDTHLSHVLRSSSALKDLKLVLSKPLTHQLALPNLCIGLGAAILIPYINVFFRERHAMPDSTLGVMFSLSAILTGVGSIAGPRLASNLGSKIRAVVLTKAQPGVPAGGRFFPVPWVGGGWLFDAWDLNEYGRPLVQRFRHGAGARARAGDGQQCKGAGLAGWLGSRALPFRRGAAGVRLHAAVHHHRDIVRGFNPLYLGIFP
jgi:MFS family permease